MSLIARAARAIFGPQRPAAPTVALVPAGPQHQPSTALPWGKRTDALINLLSGQGDPTRDKAAASRPTPGHRLTYGELDILYEEHGYARRLVDELPHDATRRGWCVMADEDEDEELRAEDEQLGLRTKVRRASSLGRLYGGFYILMVLDEGPNSAAGVQLAFPARTPRAILNLVPLEPHECQPLYWEGDPRNKRYGEPAVYLVSPTTQTDGQMAGVHIHASRILYFPGLPLARRRRLENNGHDLSVLQPLWEKVAQLDSADGNLSGFLHENNVSYVKIAGMAALSLSEQAELTELRLAEASRTRSAIKTVFMDEHDDFGVVSRTAAGLPDVHDRLKEAVSGAGGMPLTRMFGQAPGGLNADGDSQASSWREQIAAYQQDTLAPILEQYYTLQYACRGADPGADWSIHFYPLDEPTEEQRATVYKTTAEADALYFDRGVVTADELRGARFARRPAPLVVEGELPEDGEGDEAERQLIGALRADVKRRPPEQHK
jgi:phage-related protein (TIGR01555 family)